MYDYFETKPITHVSADRVLLSFDDGPKPNITPSILDILHKFGVHACFFVRGDLGVQNRQLLKRIVAEGHELGNHTWNHPKLTEISESDRFQEIKKAQKLILETTGKPARFFRPPYGEIDAQTVEMVQDKFKMNTMLWSLDPLDWSDPGVAVIHSRVIERIQGGDIVLLHEKPQTLEALPTILASLQTLNLQTVKAPVV